MLPHPSKHLVCPPNHSRFIVFKSQRLCKNILHIHFTAPNSYTWDPWHEKHCTWSSKHFQTTKTSLEFQKQCFEAKILWLPSFRSMEACEVSDLAVLLLRRRSSLELLARASASASGRTKRLKHAWRLGDVAWFGWKCLGKQEQGDLTFMIPNGLYSQSITHLLKYHLFILKLKHVQHLWTTCYSTKKIEPESWKR